MREQQQALEKLSVELSKIADKRLNELGVSASLIEIGFALNRKEENKPEVEKTNNKDNEAINITAFDLSKCRLNPVTGQWECRIG